MTKAHSRTAGPRRSLRRRIALAALCVGLLLCAGLAITAARADDPVLMTRAEAIEAAFDVLVPADLDHKATAFLTPNMLAPGDVVRSWDEDGGQYTIEGPTWFCWIDDDPQGFFEHPTRYVFIDAVSRQVTVAVERWWPVLNGVSLFMSDEEWTDPNIVIYSCVHTETIPEGGE